MLFWGGRMSETSSSRDSRLVPTIGIVALAIAIFVLDSLTPIDVSVSIFYVFVIQVASNTFGRKGILVVGLACEVLALSAHFTSPGDPWAHWAVADRAI